MDAPSGPDTKAYPGIHVHRRLAGGAAETAGTPPGQGRQDPRCRPERRAPTILGLGGLFPGELLQATDPSRKDARSERTCGLAPQGGVWSAVRWRHQKTLKTVWHATLRRAKVPYFRIYDLRLSVAAKRGTSLAVEREPGVGLRSGLRWAQREGRS